MWWWRCRNAGSTLPPWRTSTRSPRASTSATGGRLRVATKYHNLTRRFFAEKGVTGYRIVESLGATEGAPAAGIAEIIVDITTTGSTLAANHLKILDDGVILKSCAVLAGRTAVLGGPPGGAAAGGCCPPSPDCVEPCRPNCVSLVVHCNRETADEVHSVRRRPSRGDCITRAGRRGHRNPDPARARRLWRSCRPRPSPPRARPSSSQPLSKARPSPRPAMGGHGCGSRKTVYLTN